MMTPRTAGDAFAIATNWIASSGLEFSAAIIGGSVGYAEPDALLGPAQDIDCYLIVDGDAPEGKIGKILVQGALLDISWIPWSALENAEDDAFMASLLKYGRIIEDDGRLTTLQAKIKRDFLTSETLTERVDSIREKIRTGLAVDSSHLSHPEQVLNWLFPATLVTHYALAISGAPMTVRRRFLAAKYLYLPENYEPLLALFSFDTVTRQQAQSWLDFTARLFDATTEIAKKSERFWASDIQPIARHIAIDGSQQLIDEGQHREAVFWIVATSSRCLTVRCDAKVDSVDFLREYWHMLRALFMETAELRQRKSEAILDWIKY